MGNLKFNEMKRAAAILFLSTAACSCDDTCHDVTLAGLLDEMTDGFNLCEYPEVKYRARMTSSHDRRSVSPSEASWYANDDGFGYERMDTVAGRLEKVLFEDDGPGAITRIWITTLDPESVLRFYFGPHEEPDWVVDSFDLTGFGLESLEDNPLLCVHTSYEKGVKGGQTLFLPIPYDDGCKITLEEPEGRSGVPRYYNIEYREYPSDVRVETFSVETARKNAVRIREAGICLRNGIRASGKVTRGDRSITLPEGNRVVTKLSVRVTGVDSLSYGNMMRKLILKGTFDGKETINVPLGDFSGAGMGAYPVDCRQLRSDGKGLVESYWAMPYSETASFEVVSCVPDSCCRVELEAWSKKRPFTDNTLYFHSSWKAEEGLYVTNVQSECGYWDFASIKGRGVYAGDNLTLFNHSKAWYGEGDEKIYIDSETFPSFFGTGTEDYYNSSWAPVTVFNTPFGGAPRADLASSRGYNTFLRTRAGDVIPFEESFDLDLELISWTPGTVDYASTIYWYGDAESEACGCTDPLSHEYVLPEPPPDPRVYVVAGSIEAENLELLSVSEGLHIDRQDMAAFPDGLWSGARQLVLYGGKPGDSAVFRIEGLQPGRYAVALYATMAADYGIASISLNGGSPYVMDCWASVVTVSGRTYVGTADVDGILDIWITVAGQNVESKGNMLGIDCIVLEKED